VDTSHSAAEQISLFLRVGLGAVSIYEGLVPRLLAPSPQLLDLVSRWLPWLGEPTALVRAGGAFEVLLGLLLVSGWMVRSVAAVQCLLLASFAMGIAVVMPQALVHPIGATPKHVALLAAGMCLVLLGRGRDAGGESSWRVRMVPLVLRLGLGFTWVYAGILPKWLFPSVEGVEIVARTGLVSLQVPMFLKLLGAIEAALGLTILAGLWVRGMAVLQVGLLTAFTAIIGYTSPDYLVDPLGGLANNLGLLGAALVLHHTGSGPFALDATLARNPAWQRWRLLTGLQWCGAMATLAVRMFRVQAQAVVDANTRGLLEKLEQDETHHAEDIASLIRRHGGWPLPVGPLCVGAGWLLGCITVILGRRASLYFDLWMKEHGARVCQWSATLLPPEAGITTRALLAVQTREAEHIRLLRDHLRATRPPVSRRR